MAWHLIIKLPHLIFVQANSNLIANKVISGILKNSKIPNITSIIRDDALNALDKGGQSIGGWGGAFNYWDLNLDPNDSHDSVGNRIINNPAEYEKFLAVNSAAITKTMGKFGITSEQVLTALGSVLPSKVIGDITSRLFEALTEGFGFTGDPNNIDGYKPYIGADDKVIGWWSLDKNLKHVDVTDEAKIKELTDRYHVRTAKGSFHPWQDPTVGTKTQTLNLDDGTTVTQNFNADGDLVSSSSVRSDKTRTDLVYDPSTGKILSRKDFDTEGKLVDKAAEKVETDRLAAEKAAAEKAETERVAAEQATADKLRADQEAQAAAIEQQRKQEEQRKHSEEMQKQHQEMLNQIKHGLDNLIKSTRDDPNQQNFTNIQIPGPGLSPPRPEIPIFQPAFSTVGLFSSHGGGTPGVNTGILNPPIPAIRPVNSSGGGLWTGVPIGLDLNGDGEVDVHTLGTGYKSLSISEAENNYSEDAEVSPRFDWNADGVSDQTAWVGAQDGFLVIDLAKDGNSGADGVIDQPKEIAFAHWKTEEARVAELKELGIDDTGRPVTDLEGLRWAFDTDLDNVLDINDRRWSEFRVWQDANQNGVTDLGELLTMDQAGIKLINLMPSSDGSKAFPDGSAITGTSTAQMSDGTNMLVGDVSLAYRPSLAS